jgi:hypothetical protein
MREPKHGLSVSAGTGQPASLRERQPAMPDMLFRVQPDKPSAREQEMKPVFAIVMHPRGIAGAPGMDDGEAFDVATVDQPPRCPQAGLLEQFPNRSMPR